MPSCQDPGDRLPCTRTSTCAPAWQSCMACPYHGQQARLLCRLCQLRCTRKAADCMLHVTSARQEPYLGGGGTQPIIELPDLLSLLKERKHSYDQDGTCAQMMLRPWLSMQGRAPAADSSSQALNDACRTGSTGTSAMRTLRCHLHAAGHCAVLRPLDESIWDSAQLLSSSCAAVLLLLLQCMSAAAYTQTIPHHGQDIAPARSCTHSGTKALAVTHAPISMAPLPVLLHA